MLITIKVIHLQVTDLYLTLVFMLADGFNIIVEEGKFHGIMDAIDYSGEPLTLYYKTLTKEQVEYFIYKVKVAKHPVYAERIGAINTPENRLRVCKKLLASNVKYVKDFMKEHVSYCDRKIEELMTKNRNTENEIERDFTQLTIDEYVRVRDEWKRTVKAFSYKKDDTKLITEQDVLRAKEYPITNMIKFNSQGFAPCVFHQDKTPSMRYYKNSNSVHCFGCSTSGDSIKVGQQLFGENFINTVKRLCGK